MVDNSRKQQINAFIEKWKDRGDEKQDTQLFWLGFMEDVLGIQNSRDLIEFEHEVWITGKPKYIDVLYLEKEILIEQKSKGVSLNQRYHQSDGQMLSPYEQARRYAGFLPYGEDIRWIITCNFQTFEIHDLKKQGEAPIIVKLEDLAKDIGLFQFFFFFLETEIKRELDISIKAGDIVGLLYDALLSKYIDPNNVESQRHLNILITRLVFCMYAEDAGLFGDNTNKFKDYISSKDPEDLGDALERLFRVLDMPEEVRARKSNLAPALRAFPYVNGGLFAEEDIEIPLFDQELADLLIDKACSFDWSEISPTIFGAVFESTLNPETRRSGGMHYTSIENIHKVIDPLFLDELKDEFESIKATSAQKGYKNRLLKFQEKLAGLSFLDPACGSGNFLTETFLSLRRLENLAIAERLFGQQVLGDVFEENPIKVSINQFYGIEINDFAVTVARTALWIAESQMMEETEEIIRSQIDFFPLKTNAKIIEGNALKLEWESVVSPNDLTYIMGNPPFIGMQWMSKAQKDELLQLFTGNKKAGTLDYVSGWYIKAIRFIKNTRIKTAFVSTNSITQGEQIGALWKYLFSEEPALNIVFCHRTFVWNSEAKSKAAVHCVIICFCLYNYEKLRHIYAGDGRVIECKNITPYLMDGPTVFVERQTKPISDVPPIHRGNQPTDGGNLILDEEECKELLRKEPKAEKFIKRYMMGYEFLNNKTRYCLWLVDAKPNDLVQMPLVMERVKKVKAMRESSSFEQTRKMADTPTLFRETFNPPSFIAIPVVSSERRRYIPMGYLDDNTIPGNKLFMIENAEYFHFGVLESNVHMAWMRAVAGRLKSDYSYSKDIVYNCFVWPELNESTKKAISETAKGILEARLLYADSSLANLYDETIMPIELRKAHQKNDMAVMDAYGFYHTDENGKKIWFKEDETVAALMQMYQDRIKKG